jgi:hypothetical protein
LIGINSDPRSTARRGRERDNVTWRSFWDGPTTDGPIARKWNIQGWPTMYLLDAKGVIRHKSIGPMEVVEEKVAELVAQTVNP